MTQAHLSRRGRRGYQASLRYCPMPAAQGTGPFGHSTREKGGCRRGPGGPVGVALSSQKVLEPPSSMHRSPQGRSYVGPLTRHTPVLGNCVFPADSESTENGQPLWIFTTQLRLRKQKNKSREGSETHRTKTPGTGISDPFLRRPTSSHTRIVANPTPGLPQSILRGKSPRVLVKFSS